MLVVMQSHATEEQIRAVCQRIEGLGLKAHPIPGAIRTAIGITGNKGRLIWVCWNRFRGWWSASRSASRTNWLSGT
jgi:hypothetical protein